MRYLFIFLIALLPTGSIVAANPAENILEQIHLGLEKLGSYRAVIEVLYGNSAIEGEYQVEGDNFYIKIGTQEMYGDSQMQYEVINDRREIIIDNVSKEFDGNILSNPATVFASIADHFTAEVIAEDNDVVIVELRQDSAEGSSSDSIELSIWKSAGLPKSILYKYDNDQIRITIESIDILTSPITSYNSDNYTDYEVIDFR